MSRAPINIIFDGPPGPEAGRFVEVETDDGKSITIGEWAERSDGLWARRITELPSDLPPDPTEVEIFERIFDEGRYCSECVYCEHHRERHPYGEGTAQEITRSCTVPDPDHCPGVAAQQQEQQTC